MRTYRVTLFKTGCTEMDQPLYYLGEVDDHQRGDDVIQQALIALPEMTPFTCSLVLRSEACPTWPAYAQGMLQ